jgi:hypothetical protein
MSAALKHGDQFTVAGVGYDKDGWLVVNGYRVDGKRSKAIKDLVWTVLGNTGVIGAEPAVLPDAKKVKR